MNDRRVPAPNKWPFYVADALLLGVALWVLKQYPHPLPLWAATLMTGCVALAALLGLAPHRMEYSTLVKFAESDRLTNAALEVRKFQSAAESIQAATSQWQGVQEQANRTVTAAREISDRMAAEAHSFTEFMQKANDSEKAALRLEVEKLRRGEAQWLQVLVHLLDHVFALHQAGARSGQPNLREQLGQFQDACRDIVRRVGLVPVEASVDEPFDEERHQVLEGQPVGSAESRVVQTLATGYTYQGQLLRRTLVALSSNGSFASPGSASAPETAPTFASSDAEEPTATEHDLALGLDGDPSLSLEAGTSLNEDGELSLRAAAEAALHGEDEAPLHAGGEGKLPTEAGLSQGESALLSESPTSDTALTELDSTTDTFRPESEILPHDGKTRRA
jgi:molecular chaperone GrpE (heat shock protein)